MKANNIYDKTKATRSDKGARMHNQQEKDISYHKAIASHDERDDSPKYYPNPNQEHKGFQFNTNPMSESPFEKSLVMAEKRERETARDRYVEGIQGRDGGKKPFECYNINN